MQSIGYVFFFSIVFIPHFLFVLYFFLPDLNAEVILFVMALRFDFNFFCDDTLSVKLVHFEKETT